MSAPKKFLYIAYSYPPFNSIGGVRAAKFSKYLPGYGWEPVVLTIERPQSDAPQAKGLAENAGIEVVRTPYDDQLARFRLNRSAAKTKAAPKAAASAAPAASANGSTSLKSRVRATLSYWAKEILAYPDEMRGWEAHALAAARPILARGDIDLIFSTAKPFSSHIIAHKLQAEFGLPWVADLRDPWTQGPIWNHSALRTFFETRLEKHTLGTTTALTTVSPPWAEGLHALHGKPVEVIANGFDAADYAGDPPPPTAKFTITYTGSIYAETYIKGGYTGERNPGPLFEAVRRLIDSGQIDPARIALRFYGPQRDHVHLLSAATEYGVESLLELPGRVPYAESIQHQRESTVLLLLNWQSTEQTFKQQGWFTGKIYEYMGAQRPILALPSHAGVDHLLSTTHSGASANTTAEVADLLADWYAEYAATGTVAYQGRADLLDGYTRESQARLLANLFDRITAGA